MTMTIIIDIITIIIIILLSPSSSLLFLLLLLLMLLLLSVAGHTVMASMQICKGPSLVVIFALFQSALSI